MKDICKYVIIAPLAAGAAVYPGAKGIIIQEGQEAARFVPEYTLPFRLSPDRYVEERVRTESFVFAATSSSTATGEKASGV